MTSAIESADRIAQWYARHPAKPQPRIIIMAAWTLAAAQRAIPRPAHPHGDAFAILAQAVVQRDLPGFKALLTRAWEADRQLGPALLRQAEHLAALQWPEPFLAQVLKSDARAIVGATLARGLAAVDVAATLDLLARMGGPRQSYRALKALVEAMLVSGGRKDRPPAYQSLWESLGPGPPTGFIRAYWWDAHLRLLSREDVYAAEAQLQEAALDIGWEDLLDGHLAVIGRLWRVDRDAAYAAVLKAASPLQQAVWLEGALWQGELDDQGERLLDSLIRHVDQDRALAEVVLYLAARVGDGLRVEKILNRARLEAPSVVRSTAPALRRLNAQNPLHMRAVRETAQNYLAAAREPDGFLAVDRIWLESEFHPDGPWWAPYADRLP